MCGDGEGAKVTLHGLEGEGKEPLGVERQGCSRVA